MPSRERIGAVVAGLAAAGLLVLLLVPDWFRPRFDVDAPATAGAAGTMLNSFAFTYSDLSGWSTGGWLVVAWLVLLVGGGLALVTLTALGASARVTAAVATVTQAVGGFAVLMLALRLTLARPDFDFDPPPDLRLDVAADPAAVLWPAWLALGVTVLIAAAASVSAGQARGEPRE